MRARKNLLNFFEWIDQQPCMFNSLRIVIVYRPPIFDKHKVPTSTFVSEFADNLESIVLCREQLMLSGDFNIHVDNALETDCKRLSDLLGSDGLQQHVTGPTHKHDHTLDLNHYTPIWSVTWGAFFWYYSGIGRHGIDGIRVLLGPEYYSLHSAPDSNNITGILQKKKKKNVISHLRHSLVVQPPPIYPLLRDMRIKQKIISYESQTHRGFSFLAALSLSLIARSQESNGKELFLSV